MKSSSIKILVPVLVLLAYHALGVSGGGFVPVRNFDRRTYGGGSQNWDVAQDSLGRVFVGNQDGMLSFDGLRWRRHYIGNYTAVRSLLYDHPSDRLYAGASDEFGYYRPDSLTGDWRYVSLLTMLEDNHPGFTEIWNIMRHDGSIWFQSDYTLFRYDGKRVVSYPAGGRISRSAIVGRTLLLGMDDGRLLRFDGNRFVPLPGSVPCGRRVTGLAAGPQPETLLVATAFDGLFIHDGERLSPFECDLNPFLRDNQVFSMATHEGDYVFGTVTRGAVVRNFSTGETRYINKDGGLRNNTVLGIFFDRDGNIWLCLDNGISYAMYNSPLGSLIGTADAVGAGYASLVVGDKVYFGTNQGLYSSSYPFHASPSPIELTRLLTGQIWSVSQSGRGVFAAGDAGLYHRGGGSDFVRVEGIGGAHTAIPIPGSRMLALVSTYDRFHLLRADGAGWSDLGPVDGYDGMTGGFVFDRDGDVWFSHFRKGIYRMHLDTLGRRFDKIRLYTSHDGLPGDFDNVLSMVNGSAVVSGDDGFYRLDRNSDSFIEDSRLDKSLPACPRSRLFPLPGSRVIVMNHAGIEFAHASDDGTLALDPDIRAIGSDMLIPGAESASAAGAEDIIVSNQEGFWIIKPTVSRSPRVQNKPFVNTVRVNRDSIVYSASPAGIDSMTLSLPHELNSIALDFGYTDFSAINGVEFSSWLENYDDDWSPYSRQPSREYTRISEGNYEFHLRARDPVTGLVTESEFKFRVTPPWYRSNVAKIIYVVLVLSALEASILLARRWVRLSQRRVELRKEKELQELRAKSEQEALKKDYEIAALKSQQLEQDVRVKSSELSNSTMNIIRKNEALSDISTRLNKVQELMKAEEVSPVLKKQVSGIQSYIRENISHDDDDWAAFTRNFDVVYENYTKRLIEMHPNLTTSDMRLCCYIRMRLSSKEIAPLINISHKSVEMARYRLRKKMDLPAETTLTDYLLNL